MRLAAPQRAGELLQELGGDPLVIQSDHVATLRQVDQVFERIGRPGDVRGPRPDRRLVPVRTEDDDVDAQGDPGEVGHLGELTPAHDADGRAHGAMGRIEVRLCMPQYA